MRPSGLALLELSNSLIAWATISVVKRCVELSISRLRVRVLDEKVMDRLGGVAVYFPIGT